MRTTLELDDTLVTTARQLAQEQGSTIGEIVSTLALASLAVKMPATVRNGVPVFTPESGASRPDLQLVNELRDDE